MAVLSNSTVLVEIHPQLEGEQQSSDQDLVLSYFPHISLLVSKVSLAYQKPSKQILENMTTLEWSGLTSAAPQS